MAEATDTIWALREAAKTMGFAPHGESAAEFATSLERQGWLSRSQTYPFWVITPEGRAELARLEAALT